MKLEHDDITYKFKDSNEATEAIKQAFHYLNTKCHTEDAPEIHICHYDDGLTSMRLLSDDGNIGRIWRWYDPDKVICFRSLESILCNDDSVDYIKDLYNELGIDEEGAIFTKKYWAEYVAHRFETGGEK